MSSLHVQPPLWLLSKTLRPPTMMFGWLSLLMNKQRPHNSKPLLPLTLIFHGSYLSVQNKGKENGEKKPMPSGSWIRFMGSCSAMIWSYGRLGCGRVAPSCVVMDVCCGRRFGNIGQDCTNIGVVLILGYCLSSYSWGKIYTTMDNIVFLEALRETKVCPSTYFIV